MTNQAVEPSRILDLKFEKEDVAFYVVNYLPFLLIMVAMSIMFTGSRLARQDADLKSVITSGIRLLIVNLFMLAGAIIATRIIGIKGKKKYEAIVKKYGYDNIASQLKEANNTVFYLHPKRFESYVIITREYLILSRTMIIRMNEIRQLRFDRLAKGDTTRPYKNSLRASENTRFFRRVYIVNYQGVEENYPVGLTDDEYYALVNFLAYRLGPGYVYYNS